MLAWDPERGDLPWRATRDPWGVLVSEVMLQQTPVSRVAGVWEDFLDRFPTAGVCASAPVAAVVRAWRGLGYNRRAVYLHTAAQAVVERHGGRIPRDLEGLLALPGVGPYTARAVLAFAFETDHAVVDTNVGRVLARAVAGRPLTPRQAQQRADQLVPDGRAREWNQALMDLGALVCVRRDPACGRCPVARTCVWNAAGRPSPDPAEGSAGQPTSQPSFAGSDRQGRGRLVDALRSGPVALHHAPAVAGWPDDPQRARRIAFRLVAEGLAELVDGWLRLPR